jgi:maleate cis-trans isomerase
MLAPDHFAPLLSFVGDELAEVGRRTNERRPALAAHAGSGAARLAAIMPGGNWSSMPIVERLENDLGKPVLVNNAVSLWAGLRLLNRSDSIAGYGRLLREHIGA